MSDDIALIKGAKDHYAIFGLTRATFDETVVRKCFRKMALKLHPDKNPDPAAKEVRSGPGSTIRGAATSFSICECALQAFHLASTAVQTLTDPASKARYDLALSAKHGTWPRAAPASSAATWPPPQQPVAVQKTQLQCPRCRIVLAFNLPINYSWEPKTSACLRSVCDRAPLAVAPHVLRSTPDNKCSRLALAQCRARAPHAKRASQSCCHASCRMDPLLAHTLVGHTLRAPPPPPPPLQQPAQRLLLPPPPRAPGRHSRTRPQQLLPGRPARQQRRHRSKSVRPNVPPRKRRRRQRRRNARRRRTPPGPAKQRRHERPTRRLRKRWPRKNTSVSARWLAWRR